MKTSVNTAEVYTKYYIGKYIVEYEQEGNVRAQYGKQILQELSKSLTVRFGAGWSYPNLRNIRQFYIVYAKRSTTGFPFENKNANQWLANSKDNDNQMFKLSHQDLGQMQMYVNYYDRFVKQDFEKPTIGILLCESKNDALVELTLPKNSHVYASAYQLYLPDKALLQAKVKEWIAEFESNSIGFE